MTMHRNRAAIAVMRVVIAVIVVWTVYFAGSHLPLGSPVLSVALNRSGLCSVSAALKGRSLRATQASLTAGISEKVRAIRTDGEYRLWETPDGPLWMPTDSDWLVPHLLAESARHLYGSPVAKAGDIVMDCGAHVGVFTREAIKSGAKLVIAIEPAPENLTCLRRNLEQEIAAGIVQVIPKGVWDREDTLFLARAAGNSAGDRISHDKAAGIGVPLTTIDRIVSEAGLPAVNLIKMDIEGAERNALMGSHTTLSKFRPRLAIATYHRDDDPEVTQDIVLTANPAYKLRCGACAAWYGNKRIVPELLFFD